MPVAQGEEPRGSDGEEQQGEKKRNPGEGEEIEGKVAEISGRFREQFHGGDAGSVPQLREGAVDAFEELVDLFAGDDEGWGHGDEVPHAADDDAFLSLERGGAGALARGEGGAPRVPLSSALLRLLGRSSIAPMRPAPRTSPTAGWPA